MDEGSGGSMAGREGPHGLGLYRRTEDFSATISFLNPRSSLMLKARDICIDYDYDMVTIDLIAIIIIIIVIIINIVLIFYYINK